MVKASPAMVTVKSTSDILHFVISSKKQNTLASLKFYEFIIIPEAT